MKKAVVILFLTIGLMMSGTGFGWAQQSGFDGYQKFNHDTQKENFEKALQLFKQHKLTSALKILEKLYDDNFNLFYVSLHLGDLYLTLGRYDEALKVYKRFAERFMVKLKRLGFPSKKNITYSHFYYNLGTLYIKLNRTREGIDALKKVLKSHNYRAPIEQSDRNEAFFTLTPREFYANVHYRLGMAYLQLGDKKNAVKQYERLKELDEHQGETFRQLLCLPE